MSSPPAIRHVTASNPGLLTLEGTNQYLLGKEEITVVDVALSSGRNIDGIIRSEEHTSELQSPAEICPVSLHAALPIWSADARGDESVSARKRGDHGRRRRALLGPQYRRHHRAGRGGGRGKNREDSLNAHPQRPLRRRAGVEKAHRREARHLAAARGISRRRGFHLRRGRQYSLRRRLGQGRIYAGTRIGPLLLLRAGAERLAYRRPYSRSRHDGHPAARRGHGRLHQVPGKAP